MEDINRKRFELELQLAAERGMDVEAKIHNDDILRSSRKDIIGRRKGKLLLLLSSSLFLLVFQLVSVSFGSSAMALES